MSWNPHKSSSASPFELIASQWRNRHLIGQMIVRDVAGRYKGSAMGLAWSFLNPLFMLAVYTFVFSVVFKAKWGGDGHDTKIGFAIVLFVGMIVHGLFAECVNRSPSLIVHNANYVKRVVFPLEILPTIALGSAAFHTLISTLVLIGALVVNGSDLHWEILLAPILMLPLALATLGFSWFLASLGVFLRDIGQLTTIMTTALLFLAPVFFPLSAMPEKYRILMQLNPLTLVIEQMRGAIIWGKIPDWNQYSIYLGVSFLLAWAGFWWFQRTRKGFADVI